MKYKVMGDGVVAEILTCQEVWEKIRNKLDLTNDKNWIRTGQMRRTVI